MTRAGNGEHAGILREQRVGDGGTEAARVAGDDGNGFCVMDSMMSGLERFDSKACGARMPAKPAADLLP